MILPMRGMRPEDVYALKGVSDPRLDPSGTTVAYVVWEIDREANEYRGNIWFAPVDGSSEPRRFTTGEKRDGQPRWSPDGSRLAFTSSRAEEEPGQLFMLPVAGGGEALRLTRLKEDVVDIAWSPDSRTIAFSSRLRDEAYEHEEDERRRPPRRITRLLYKLDDVGWTVDRRKQLFVVPADGSDEPRRLTEGEYENAQPAWSPDGTRLAFVSARTEHWDLDLVEDIYLVGSEGGEPERLTDATASCGSPVWSPDGRQIAYEYTPDPFSWPRHTQIAVIDVATREWRVLTGDLDLQCGPYPQLRIPAWDGDRIVFAVEVAGRVHVYEVQADGSRAPKALVEGDRVVRGYDVRGDAVVHASSTATTFPELYVGESRVTDVTGDFAERLIAPEPFTARSADGTEVDAWLVRPAGFEEGKRYPVLLSIHGGPFSQYVTGFFDEFQVYAGAGYAVVYSNPRGSSGYSEEWGRAIRGPLDGGGPGWGSVDYEDVMAVMDEALERFDSLDPERTGVLGGSYGGFMTSWIVGHTNRFQAACSERAVNNLYTAAGSSDIFWAFKGYVGTFAHEAVQEWLELSPALYADGIETPLLIMHSEDDLRCNVEQAEHLFVTMRLLGKVVELVRFPGESHELSRSGSPIHRVQRFELLLDWFDRYLQRQPDRLSASTAQA
jgi:dipeptidyl aminopeptidase/acylaminoacyl peptidase